MAGRICLADSGNGCPNCPLARSFFFFMQVLVPIPLVCGQNAEVDNAELGELLRLRGRGPGATC